MDEEFLKLAIECNLDHDTIECAWGLWSRICPCFCPEDAIRPLPWYACTIYIASNQIFRYSSSSSEHSKGSVMPWVSVGALIRYVDLEVARFYEMLLRLLSVIALISWPEFQSCRIQLEHHVMTRLQRHQVAMICCLKFPAIFEAVFAGDGKEKCAAFHVVKQKIKDMCWLLFAYARLHYWNESCSLRESFTMLISCINFCYINARQHPVLRNPQMEMAMHRTLGVIMLLVERCASPPILNDMFVEVAQMWTCIMHPFFLNMMHDKKLLLGAELSMNFCTSAAGDRLSTRDFSELQNSKECIRKAYDYLVLSNGIVDETLLISGDARISSDTAQGLSVVTSSRSKACFASKSYSSEVLALKRIAAIPPDLDNIPQDLMNVIVAVVKLNSHDWRTPVIDTLQILKTKIAVNWLHSDEHELPVLIAGLYFKILAAILTQECSRIRSAHVINVLWQKTSFHNSLIACCTEMVMSAYKMDQYSFPWVCKALELDGLEFQKIIEIVMRCRIGLPPMTQNRLVGIENTVLDSYIWQRSSVVWKHVVDKSNISPTAHEARSTLERPISSLKSLEILHRKVLQRAAAKLAILRSKLDISCLCAKFVSKIARCALDRHLDLLVDLKVDYVILSSMFCALRVVGANASFSTLMPSFPNLDLATDTHPATDIIGFYNNAFVPRMVHDVQCMLNDSDGAYPSLPEPMMKPASASENTILSPRVKIVDHSPRGLAVPSKLSYSFQDLTASRLTCLREVTLSTRGTGHSLDESGDSSDEESSHCKRPRYTVPDEGFASEL